MQAPCSDGPGSNTILCTSCYPTGWTAGHCTGLAPHVIVAALGFSALEACQQHTYSHHCVLEHNWPGPDKQYDFATPW